MREQKFFHASRITRHASLEKLLGLLEKSLRERGFLAVAERGELMQLRLLRTVQMRRHLDLDANVQIALAIALQIFHAAAFESQQRAGLRAGGNFDRRTAFERRHFNLRAQRGLHKTHGNFAEQIVAVARKNFVALDVQENIQIAGRPAAKTGLAVALRTQTRSALDARRNAQLDLGRALFFAVAVTRLARFFEQAALAFAMRARLRDAENAARRQHLAASAAGRAGFQFGARLRAGAVAGFALVELRDGNFLFTAERGFFQRDLQVVAQIVAALRAGGILIAAKNIFKDAATAAAAKHFPAARARHPARRLPLASAA